ncbi:DUF2273 domain-containing protein [Alicyclobacillus tolerans]|uniref:Small integral membrane protein n=2 Tax=Alicyclobacillus tolerans TaxID=90970 RepID=A0A1M6S528_9BACL|nr:MULTISPECIES: DUF2273 domain-containing protein [Alicyclobacillus]MDP9728739.1 putative membrane protein [Alicyclobacillus tengchongensis]QRF23247.1 DUF2273 domain-containing protein [Alicyclobacillus sp. TC]SHK39628.1 Small integral membrane protein [Alicyclobacillus montanus]
MPVWKQWLIKIWTMQRRWLGFWAGCLLWFLWMIFGFWSMILLLVLAALGFAVGRILEERQSWRKILDKLLSDRYME